MDFVSLLSRAASAAWNQVEHLLIVRPKVASLYNKKNHVD